MLHVTLRLCILQLFTILVNIMIWKIWGSVCHADGVSLRYKIVNLLQNLLVMARVNRLSRGCYYMESDHEVDFVLMFSMNYVDYKDE